MLTEMKLMIGGAVIITLFLMLGAALSDSTEHRVAETTCNNFCSITKKEVRLFDDGICICKDK